MENSDFCCLSGQIVCNLKTVKRKLEHRNTLIIFNSVTTQMRKCHTWASGYHSRAVQQTFEMKISQCLFKRVTWDSDWIGDDQTTGTWRHAGLWTQNGKKVNFSRNPKKKMIPIKVFLGGHATCSKPKVVTANTLNSWPFDVCWKQKTASKFFGEISQKSFQHVDACAKKDLLFQSLWK